MYALHFMNYTLLDCRFAVHMCEMLFAMSKVKSI